MKISSVKFSVNNPQQVKRFIELWPDKKRLWSEFGISRSHASHIARRLRDRGCKLEIRGYKASNKALYDIPDDEFVRMYNEAETAISVAKAIDVDPVAVRNRAYRLRERGIKPKKRGPALVRRSKNTRGKRRIIAFLTSSEVERLNEVLERCDIDFSEFVARAILEAGCGQIGNKI